MDKLECKRLVECIGDEFARSGANVDVEVVQCWVDNQKDDYARLALPSAVSGTMGGCAASPGYVVNACGDIFVQGEYGMTGLEQMSSEDGVRGTPRR